MEFLTFDLLSQVVIVIVLVTWPVFRCVELLTFDLLSPRVSGGLVDAGPEYHKALADEVAKLQRLYGGGDLDSFPEFIFPGTHVNLQGLYIHPLYLQLHI